MRYFISLAFISGIAVIGCSRGDDAPKEIVVHIKMDGDPGSKEAAERTMVHATKSVVAVFKTPLDMYELDVGHFPSSADGLMALKAKPASGDAGKWQGPYLVKDVPRDAWDRELRYERPGKHNTESYDVWSLGPDGTDGTDDDIGNW